VSVTGSFAFSLSNAETWGFSAAGLVEIHAGLGIWQTVAA
jgi:hypothetical protein